MVSALPQLTKLDFYNQLLTGTLPSNISFPKLVEMRLIANDISVRPPALLLRSTFSQTPLSCACNICCMKHVRSLHVQEYPLHTR